MGNPFETLSIDEQPTTLENAIGYQPSDAERAECMDACDDPFMREDFWMDANTDDTDDSWMHAPIPQGWDFID